LENLFPAFQQLITIVIYVYEPKINAPKQYACFLETILLKQKKTGIPFLE
jgi:hypothetical protein